MELSTRNWSIQYDALKKRIQTQRIKGINFTQDDIRLIEGQWKLLDTQLKTMSMKSFEFELAPSETARRELLLENLNKVISNFSKGNNSLNNNNNNAYGVGYTGTIGSSSSSSSMKGSSSVGNGSGKLSPTSSYNVDVSNPLSIKDRSLTYEIMKKQDEMVLEIGQGVERLHNKALVIGEEAKAHTRLLENFDSNIEIATAALQEEARHAAEIKEKGKVCYMYICIVVEVLVLLLIIIIAFGTR